MSAPRPYLVAVDGRQIATVPRRRVRNKARRQEQEIALAILKEHLGQIDEQLGHLAYSVGRIRTMAGKLEASLGISVPDVSA